MTIVIIFLIISIVFSTIIVYLIGRLVYPHNQLIRAYKESEWLLDIHIMFGLLMTTHIWLVLIVFNNDIWHILIK